MLFFGSTVIPENTTKELPFEYTIPAVKGTIKRVSVYFPWGCAGLVGIQIFRYTWQLVPNSRGEWLIGNEVTWSEEPFEPLDTEPFEVLVKGYNLDDTYPHTPLIGVEMTPINDNTNLSLFLKSLGF